MENEYLSVNLKEKKEKCSFILTISGLGHENKANSYILLEDSFGEITICGVTNKKRDFFINDLTYDTANHLKLISGDFFQKILITHSMGGYFGVFLERYIDFDLYFICSPYLSLDRDELKLSDDENFFLIEKLLNNNIEKYCVDMIKFHYITINSPEKFIIVLDPKINEDQKQFNLIKNRFPEVNIILIPHSGHLSLYLLERERVLSKFIKENIKKNIDSEYIRNLIDFILNWSLKKIENKESKICILNQLFYINSKNLDYFNFVLNINNYSDSEYFFILDKYGMVLSFSLSRKRYSYIHNPFGTINFIPILFRKNCDNYNNSFCFYNGNYIEMNSFGLNEELCSMKENFIHVPINNEILNKIYSKFDFASKLAMLSVIEYNKKNVIVESKIKSIFILFYKSIIRNR